MINFRLAIARLKNNQVVRVDDLSADLFKYMVENNKKEAESVTGASLNYIDNCEE